MEIDIGERVGDVRLVRKEGKKVELRIEGVG